MSTEDFQSVYADEGKSVLMIKKNTLTQTKQNTDPVEALVNGMIVSRFILPV